MTHWLILAAAGEPIPFTTTIVGIITASATALIAVGGIITALGVFLPILRQTRATVAKVDQVHQLVNQQHTDLVRYQAALVKALRTAGVEVPDDQSLPPEKSTASETGPPSS